jgi:protein SCO1/2
VTRRTLLLALGASSVSLGAGAALYRARSSRESGVRQRSISGTSERSIYGLGATWTTDAGQRMKLVALAGRVELVAMMFTSCPSVCPTFVREMLTLDRSLPGRLREHTHNVLVSIDPERDTPEVLARYREKMGLDPERFTLLRGAPGDVRELAQVLGVSYGKSEGSDIAHTRLVTVLDARGEVVHQQTGVSDDRERLIAGINRADGQGAG